MRPTDLDGASPVVRGGKSRDVELLVATIEDNIADGDGPVLSVFVIGVGDETSFEAAVARACREGPIPHTTIQVSTVRKMREAGFALVQEGDENESHCHHHVYFTQPVTDSQVRDWVDCFEQPTPNPAPTRRPSS